MATYAFLRGWINSGPDLSGQIRDIVATVLSQPKSFGISEDYAAQLLACWHFPTANGPAADFVLLGATVRKALLPLFKAQLAKIASEVIDVDGEDIYNIVGRIEVTIEGHEENEEWIIAEGRLDTSSRRSYFLSP